MRSFQLVAFSAALLFVSVLAAADDIPAVSTGHGVVHKVEKEMLTIKQRGADGKFEKELVLKLTGTSRFSQLSSQKRAEKLVLVQKDIESKNLAEKQLIAVIFAKNGDEHVLLAAVVQSP